MAKYYIYTSRCILNVSNPSGDIPNTDLEYISPGRVGQVNYNMDSFTMEGDGRCICYVDDNVTVHNPDYNIDITGKCYYILGDTSLQTGRVAKHNESFYYNDGNNVWRTDKPELSNLNPLNTVDWQTTNINISLTGSVIGSRSGTRFDYPDGIIRAYHLINNTPETTQVWIGLNGHYFANGAHAIYLWPFANITSKIGLATKPSPTIPQISSTWTTTEAASDTYSLMDIAMTLLGRDAGDGVPASKKYHVEDPDPFIGNMYITHDLEQAKEYLRSGKVPDDAKIYTTDEEGNPVDHEKPPEPEPEPGDGSDNIDNTPDNVVRPNDGAYSIAGINVYEIKRDKLTQFITWFWEEMVDDWQAVIINSITGLYSNMSNCVISIKKMFVQRAILESSLTPVTSMQIGRYVYNVGSDCNKVNGGAQEKYLIGTFDCKNYYQNFVDYAPHTSISLYLPFVGVVPLNTDLVMGRKIHVSAVADIHSMEICYTIKVSNDGNNRALIATYTGVCGCVVPFSLDNGMDIASNSINAVGRLLTGHVSTDISAPIAQNTGSSTTLSMYDPTHCHIIIERDRYNNPQGYGHRIGYRLEKRMTLSECDGFTVIDNPVLSGINATREEKEEIARLMKEGIYLRKGEN